MTLFRAVKLLAVRRRHQVALARLAVAGHENARRPSEERGEHHGSAAELAFQQREVQVAQASAADFLRQVGGEEADVAALAGDLQAQFARHGALALHHGFVRIELLLDEAAHGIDDHLLLVAEAEVHRAAPILSSLPPWLPLLDRKITRLNSS